MIRPASEIEYPPSKELTTRAAMIARMEELTKNSKSLMAVIKERMGAEIAEDEAQVEALTKKQEQLISNMKALLKAA